MNERDNIGRPAGLSDVIQSNDRNYNNLLLLMEKHHRDIKEPIEIFKTERFLMVTEIKNLILKENLEIFKEIADMAVKLTIAKYTKIMAAVIVGFFVLAAVITAALFFIN